MCILCEVEKRSYTETRGKIGDKRSHCDYNKLKIFLEFRPLKEKTLLVRKQNNVETAQKRATDILRVFRRSSGLRPENKAAITRKFEAACDFRAVFIDSFLWIEH